MGIWRWSESIVFDIAVRDVPRGTRLRTKTSIITHFPLEKYIPPNLARREKLKTKGRHIPFITPLALA